MKKRALCILVTVVLLLCMLPTVTSAASITTAQPTGSGTAESPYQIGTAAELYWFANEVNENKKTGICAELTADIVVNTGVLKEDGTLVDDTSGFVSWTPIGDSSPYTGTFDGKGHTVSGLFYSGNNSYVGLFGSVSDDTVKNVGVTDSYFNAGSYVGGICGNNTNGTVSGCYFIGSLIGKSSVGGVCGYNEGGTISDCYHIGSVAGSSSSVGGVCGYNTGAISGSYHSGTVSGQFYYVGGVCGYNGNGTIIGCFNTGSVTNNNSFVGGVCGCNNADKSSTNVIGCYSIGTITGTDDYAGGIFGQNYATVSDCYFSEGSATSAGKNSRSGKTINVESKTEVAFKNGTVLALLNTALENANSSVVFYQGKTSPNFGDTGEKGDPGITPQLKIGEDNYWYVSYDDGATWASLGVKATGEKGDKGDTGAQGEKGDTGAQGEKGDKGDTGAQGEKGDKGDTGTQGEKGDTGKDGQTPRIGTNGNWWIGDTDTGVKASANIDATSASSTIILWAIACVSLLCNLGLIVSVLLKKEERHL